MKIVDVRAEWIKIPLARGAAIANKKITERDYVIVRVKTEDGVEGIGTALDGVLSYVSVEHILKPMVIGQSIFDVKKIWDTMYRRTLLQGRRGSLIRGISAIDIAIWDAIGKTLNKPLCKVLGASRDSVPCYYSVGYYMEGGTTDELVKDVKQYVDKGQRSIKIRTGGLSPEEDAERLAAVRAAVGPDINLMLDANNAWVDAHSAARAMKLLEPSNPYWVEEPVRPDSFKAGRDLRKMTPIPIATGEVENTRWGFQLLLDYEAADIWQPDVCVVGGITEWMRVAALASASDIKVCPHYWWDIHVHLACAVDNAMFLEYFPTDHIVNFDKVLVEKLPVIDGKLTPPNRPGIGWQLDEDKVAQFKHVM